MSTHDQSTVNSVDRESLFAWAVRLEWFTIIWNVLEAVVAITAGLLAGSTALTAFGADSSIEVIAAVALFWRLKQTGAAASVEQHSAAERRALYVVAGTFVLLSIYIAVESTLALWRHDEPESSTIGMILATVSLIVMPILAWSKGRIGRAIDSRALQADAIETWVCSYLSLTLLAGVGLNNTLGWWWADPMGALAMLPVTVWQAWETFEDAGDGEPREDVSDESS